MRTNLTSVSCAGLLVLTSSLAFAMGKKQPQQPLPVPADVQAANPMVPTNLITSPVVPKPGAVNYSVNVKFTNHGVDIPAETISRLVHAVEVVYSQCDGVNFHVNVVGQNNAPYTTGQDDLDSSLDGVISLNDRFQNFYSQFSNNASSDYISVDLVDFLDSSSRASAKEGGVASETFLGQAFSAAIMDNLWKDGRSSQYRTSPVSNIGGNTIRLGMDMMKIAESTKIIPHIVAADAKGNRILDDAGNPIPVLAWHAYQSTLLAHEMGHILMETQDGKSGYIDHDCPELGVTCPQGYLMSGGGFDDKTYLRVPQMDETVIGYSPLPLVEKAQCNALIHHPLVSVLSSAK